MREKYVEERFPRYFIFGESKTEDSVDVNDGTKDVAIRITRANAESIIKERNALVTFIYELANAFDKADKDLFNNFWYGGKDREEDKCNYNRYS